MSAVLLDTHVLLWWSENSSRLSRAAVRAVERADELAVSPVTWVELALLGMQRRVVPRSPVRSWLEQLAREVRTVPLSPAVAARAAELPAAFPRDPFDRVIYATAVEHGWRLVSRDDRLRAADSDHVVLW